MCRKLRCIVIFLLFFSLPSLIFAQDDPSVETDWDNYEYDLYSAGDQTFMISLGMVIPLAFTHNGNTIKNNIEPPIGGKGSLVYNYFLASNFFVGGEFAGMFMPTLQQDTLYFILIGARAGTQFIAGRFEFPIAASVGMIWHIYRNDRYYGLYLKGGGSAFFRATSSWAFGLSAFYYWIPQWTEKGYKDIDGHFMDITFSARYHF